MLSQEKHTLIRNEDGRMKTIIGHSVCRAFCAISILVFAMSAQAASFDCAKAGTKVEHMICDNPEISKLDDELNVAYKAALKYKDRADFIKRYQRKWLVQRNLCATPDCVKRLYEKQLLILPSPSASSGTVSAANKSEGKSPSSGGTVPGFRLIRGKGAKVCDVYGENVNSFINPINKYNRINPKFSQLSRPESKPLNEPPDSKIYPEMYELVWERDINPAGFSSQTFWRGTKKEYSKAKDQFFHGNENMLYSRILTKIDLDNDGAPENVILASFCGGCGYLIFVAQDDLLGLDYAKTRLLVKDPTVAERGILRTYVAGEWKLPKSVASGDVNVVTDSPHAADYGFFTYEGKNYYYMMWNDPLLLQEDGSPSGINYRATRLHVFLAEKKVVKEVCTYQYIAE